MGPRLSPYIPSWLRPNTNSFKFLVFERAQGDDDANPDYSLWQSTLHNAYKANPDARFFTVVGDEAQALSIFIGTTGLLHAKALLNPSLTCQSRETQNAVIWPRSCRSSIYMGQFNVPNNGPYSNDQAYSFDYGNMHIIVLDSQLREEQEIIQIY